MLNKEEIRRLLKISGKVRGVVFHTDAKYVLEKKGKRGLEMLEAEIRKIEQSIDYGKEITATGWYPLGWRVLSLLAIQEVFNWGEKEILKMGAEAPRHSFIVRTLLRYFISPEKIFNQSSKYWKKHYSLGKLEALEVNTKEKHVVLQLKDFKIHPILCIYFKGYFKELARIGVGIRPEDMIMEETKCMFRGDSCHEFVIDWK